MQLLMKKGVGPEGPVLSYAEEKAAEQRIQDYQSEIEGKEIKQGLAYQPKDPRSSEKWLQHYKKMKDAMGAKRFEGSERTRAEIEIRRIEQRIAQMWGGRVPTFREYWINQKAGIQYLNLVNKIAELDRSREYAELIKRWRSLRRGMEPTDPYADNVLHLFKS